MCFFSGDLIWSKCQLLYLPTHQIFIWKLCSLKFKSQKMSRINFTTFMASHLCPSNIKHQISPEMRGFSEVSLTQSNAWLLCFTFSHFPGVVKVCNEQENKKNLLSTFRILHPCGPTRLPAGGRPENLLLVPLRPWWQTEELGINTALQLMLFSQTVTWLACCALIGGEEKLCRCGEGWTEHQALRMSQIWGISYRQPHYS